MRRFLFLLFAQSVLGEIEDFEIMDHHVEARDENKTSQENGGLIFGFVALTLGIAVSWGVSKVLPSLDTAIALMITGALYGVTQDTDFIIGVSNSKFIDYITPLSMITSMLELNTHMASILAPQYLLVAIPGLIIIAIGNAALVNLLQISTDGSSLSTSAMIAIGAALCHPNGNPTKAILKAAGISSRFLVLTRGEVMFSSILPNIIIDIAQSNIQISDDRSEQRPIKADSKMSSHILDIGTSFMQSTIGLMSAGLGVGFLFLWVIELMSNKRSKLDKQLQIALTIVCTYGAFYAGYYGIGRSGQLSVVMAGWVLAWRMWFSIINKAELKSFWKTVNFFADCFQNFILGAIISGTLIAASNRLASMNGYYLMVISHTIALWIGVSVVRICVFVVLRPFVNMVGQPISISEALLWGWVGTVKGKMGTVMLMFRGLHVLQTCRDNPEAQKYGEDMLLFGAGVTFLSLAINAPITGQIVKLLGMVSTPGPAAQIKAELAARVLQRKAKELGIETGDRQLELSCPNVYETLKESPGLEVLSHVGEDVYTSTVRGILFDQIDAVYWQWCEGRNRKVMRLISGVLIESIKFGKDNSKRKLKDWFYVITHLPKRTAEVIYLVQLYMRAQRLAQGMIVSRMNLSVLKDEEEDAFSKHWKSAWETVRKESNMNCALARRLLAKLNHKEMVKDSNEQLEAADMCVTIEGEARFLSDAGLYDEFNTLTDALEMDLSNLDKNRLDKTARVGKMPISKSMVHHEGVSEEESDEDGQRLSAAEALANLFSLNWFTDRSKSPDPKRFDWDEFIGDDVSSGSLNTEDKKDV